MSNSTNILKNPSNLYVIVCGALASGKTTLTKILSEHFGWHPILEDLSSNPYFIDYYNNNHKWGFQTVISFLISALEIQSEISKILDTTSVCQDWFYREHHEIYGVHVFNEGIVDQRDFDTFSRLHNVLLKYATPPSIVVFLRSSKETILSRLSYRQRLGEAGCVQEEYVSHLINVYDEWISSINYPIIEINSDKYNYLENDDDKYEVINIVERAVSRL